MRKGTWIQILGLKDAGVPQGSEKREKGMGERNGREEGIEGGSGEREQERRGMERERDGRMKY